MAEHGAQSVKTLAPPLHTKDGLDLQQNSDDRYSTIKSIEGIDWMIYDLGSQEYMMLKGVGVIWGLMAINMDSLHTNLHQKSQLVIHPIANPFLTPNSYLFQGLREIGFFFW